MLLTKDIIIYIMTEVLEKAQFILKTYETPGIVCLISGERRTKHDNN